MERDFSGVIVKPSPIHGVGVFAARDFRAGEVIFDTSELRLVTDEDPLREGEEERHCDWLADGRQSLLPAPARYINHSCEPNAYMKILYRHILFIALRDITPGEEICIDYETTLHSDKKRCSCGEPSCRGTINKLRRTTNT